MKQYEAVIQTLDRLGGQATLAELYQEVMKMEECRWVTKTPFASIRRILQVRPEIIKIRPGLWALRSYQSRLGLVGQDSKEPPTAETIVENHSYYQGLLVHIGNLCGFGTFVPNQDKNRRFVNRVLGEVRSLRELPAFSHDFLVKRCGTVDVTWFNARQMPNSFFEVEHTTDIQSSLVKFHDLQDFYARMVIVADDHRHAEFDQKIKHSAFDAIKSRVNFFGYEMLVKQYEHEMLKASQPFVI